MLFISTRGSKKKINFEDVMFKGLADDGGLYLPEVWPTFSKDEWYSLNGKSYIDIAEFIISPFVGSLVSKKNLKEIIRNAYIDFSYKSIAPLTKIDSNQWLLELYHGPTLAFKDIAMQFIAKFMDKVLIKNNKRLTIICATSGDTGGAAVKAFMLCKHVDLFVLHPYKKISLVQRRQMTTTNSINIHNIAIKGTFDDCQNQVKAMFNDSIFRKQVSLSSVNSINWIRIITQVVYYVTSSLAVGGVNKICDFTVPTGNFGNIFAAYVASKMGFPIGKLIIATNENNILKRALTTGYYNIHKVIETTSPSMDIQISSNFERLLFEVSNRNSEQINYMMNSLKKFKQFKISPNLLSSINKKFKVGTANKVDVAKTMKILLNKNNKLIDPHTAVAVNVAQYHLRDNPMIVLSTAHPAKFPVIVKKVTGVHPKLPNYLLNLFKCVEKYSILNNDTIEIMKFIKNNIN